MKKASLHIALALAFFGLTCLVGLAHGADQAPRPPQAPCVNVCQCPCDGPGNCNCGNDCQCEKCHDYREQARYDTAYKASVGLFKPLVIWVGDSNCLPCRQQLSECVHVHLDSYQGDKTGRVIVCKPRAGRVFIVEVLDGLPSVETIRESLKREIPPAPQSSAPPPPVYMPVAETCRT